MHFFKFLPSIINIYVHIYLLLIYLMENIELIIQYVISLKLKQFPRKYIILKEIIRE